MKFFDAYLKYRYNRANALTPGQQLEVVRQLRREAQEEGRVPLSETTTAVLPVHDPRVQAILRGEPITLGKAQISRPTNKLGERNMDIQSWPLWSKIVLLLAIPAIVFVVGFFLLKPSNKSETAPVAMSETPTVTVPAIASTAVFSSPGYGGQNASVTLVPTATPTPVPTPTPMAAVPENLHPASEPLGVTTVEIAGNRFVLSAAGVDSQGLWTPQGPEWLSGTLVRPVVAIPASMLDVGILRPGLPIVVRRRSGQTWTYTIDSVMEVARTQTEVIHQDRPGVVVVLVPPEPGEQRTVILGSPEFDVRPTPTPMPSTSSVPQKVRAVVTSGPLRLHTTPALSGTVKGLLKAGTVVYVIADGPPIMADGYSWVHVWVPDGSSSGAGTTGWVVERFLSFPNLYP